MALGPAETPRDPDRAGEGPYLPRLRRLPRTRARGRGPGAPGRRCRHHDAVPKLRECIGICPRPLPRGGQGSWPARAAGPPRGALRTSHGRANPLTVGGPLTVGETPPSGIRAESGLLRRRRLLWRFNLARALREALDPDREKEATLMGA